jgi:hypothetical protein
LKRLIDLDRRQQEDHDGQKGEESEEQESQEKSRSEKIREEIVEEDREEDFQEKGQEAGKEARTEEEASEEKAGSACAEASRSETARSEASKASEASEASRSEAPAATRSGVGYRFESAAIAAIGAIRRPTDLRRDGQALRGPAKSSGLHLKAAAPAAAFAFLFRIALRQQPSRPAGHGFHDSSPNRCAWVRWNRQNRPADVESTQKLLSECNTRQQHLSES